MMSAKYKEGGLLILCGPSGSGKDTVARILCHDYDYHRIITYTTRPKRPREKNGVDYYFISDKKFDEMKDAKKFAETKEYHPASGDVWKYGSKITNGDILSRHDSLIILTPAGIRDVVKDIPEFKRKRIYVVELLCDIQTMKERLMKRGDDPDEVTRRIAADTNDFLDTEDITDFAIASADATPVDLAEHIWHMTHFRSY